MPSNQIKVRHKIVLLGAAKVGKSALLQNYIDKTKPVATYKPTIFTDFLVKDVKDHVGNTVMLQLFDSPGGAFLDSNPILRGAAAFVIVVALTDRKKTCDIAEKLIQEINKDEENKDIPKILVATKSDILVEAKVNAKLEKLKKFAKNYKLDFNAGTNVTSIDKTDGNVDNFFGHVVELVQSVALTKSVESALSATLAQPVQPKQHGYNPKLYSLSQKPQSDKKRKQKDSCWSCCYWKTGQDEASVSLLDDSDSDLFFEEPKTKIEVVQQKKEGPCCTIC